MDHGVAVGPIEGLEDMATQVEQLGHAGADAVLVHSGVARTVDSQRMGLIVHLSGATRLTEEPNWKAQLTTVTDAVRLGAEAVSVHINVGSPHEQQMLESFSRVMDECNNYGMPVLAMMYPRGPSINDEHAYEFVSHAARLGYELGADMVKTNYTGSVESFRKIVRSIRVPILVAGGPRAKTDADVLKMASEAIRAGASGVSIGRNVFQHNSPKSMTQALVSIVHKDTAPEEALKILDREDGNGQK